MLSNMKPETEATFSVDRTSNTIRFVRVIAAPPARIFAAWTRPEHVSHWWDPSGERLPVCEIELRPGGRFRFVTKAYPEMPFAGTYQEIVPPSRLSFEAMGATGRVELSAEGGGTRMTVEIECSSAEHLEQFVRIGIARDTARTIDNLVEYASKARWPD